MTFRHFLNLLADFILFMSVVLVGVGAIYLAAKLALMDW